MRNDTTKLLGMCVGYIYRLTTVYEYPTRITAYTMPETVKTNLIVLRNDYYAFVYMNLAYIVHSNDVELI
jgi:hypothetical protein